MRFKFDLDFGSIFPPKIQSNCFPIHSQIVRSNLITKVNKKRNSLRKSMYLHENDLRRTTKTCLALLLFAI